MTDKTYTPADFSRARFAVHPERGDAARIDPGSSDPWGITTSANTPYAGRWRSDAVMAADGWRPVVPLPDPDDLDARVLDRAADHVRLAYQRWNGVRLPSLPGWDDIPEESRDRWRTLASSVIASLASPPEPTEEERAAEQLDRILDEWRCTSRSSGLTLAEHMASRGVRVTETEEEGR